MDGARHTVVCSILGVVLAGCSGPSGNSGDWRAPRRRRASRTWRWSHTFPFYGAAGASTVDDGARALPVSGLMLVEDDDGGVPPQDKGFWSGFRFEKHLRSSSRLSMAVTLIDDHPGVTRRPSADESWNRCAEESVRVVVRRYFGSGGSPIQAYVGAGGSFMHTWAEYRDSSTFVREQHDKMAFLPTADLGVRWYYWDGGGRALSLELGANAAAEAAMARRRL